MSSREELFVTVFESAPVGMVITDDEGRILRCNRAFEQIVGYKENELSGNTFAQFTHPHDLAENLRLFKELVGKERDHFAMEKRYVLRDGAAAWVHLTAFSLPNVDDNFQCLAIVEDVTERKLTEENINETSRLVSIGELAAGVAHELNNPLTSVMGFSQLLMDEQLPQQIHEDLQRVYSEAQRAAKIVQNLLSFARRSEPEKQYLDLRPILESAVEIKSYDFKVNNINVNTQLSPDLPRSMVDQQQLLQLVLNILTNAEQAMTETSGGGELTLAAIRAGDKIRISIADDGPGIKPENVNKIFDPFFTTKGVGNGTGLGLSIAYGLVRQHGGDVWVESELGQGTTFHLELPILEFEGEEEVTSEAPVQETPHGEGRRILVVDDEQSIRTFLEAALSRKGYQVDLVEDGMEAWHKLESTSYECIILDLKMPGISGEQLYRRIAELDEEKAKRVIFFTGDTLSFENERFLSSTGNSYLSKPVDVEELWSRIFELQESSDG